MNQEPNQQPDVSSAYESHAGTAPPPGPPGPKRLFRSRTDRRIGGVCAGLAAYLGVDPSLVRVLAVVSIVLPGPQVIAYIAAWILVPEEPWAPAAGN